MLSFWEENSFTKYDVVIVGGGIVGLSTAASLLESKPDLDVLILERGLFPSGASTKNAGFACFGSVSELWNDWKQLGEERMLGLVKQRWEGLQKLRNRLGEKAIGYLNNGGYELLREEELLYLEKIPIINKALYPIFKEEVFKLASDKIPDFGFARSKVKSMVENPFEAQIDTGEMMQSLWRYVNKLGAKILTGAEVLGWDSQESGFNVSVKNTLSSDNLEFSAHKLAICSNAFSASFFPDMDIEPGRGQVLITDPIENLKVKGVFHLQEGYYYFRNYGNRILLGGGRNLDFKGETTIEMQTTRPIIEALESLLNQVIIPKVSFSIAKTWAGIMAFGSTKEPICQEVEDRLFAAVRLGGMGIAIGSALGEELALKLLK